jgi:hypothetical protein
MFGFGGEVESKFSWGFRPLLARSGYLLYEYMPYYASGTYVVYKNSSLFTLLF